MNQFNSKNFYVPYVKKQFFLFLLLFSLVFSIQVSNSASDTERLDIEMTITDFKVSTKSDSLLSGSFTLTNKSENVLPSLWYTTELYYNHAPAKSNLINFKPVPLNMGKFEKKALSFQHTIPAAIPQGEYTLLLRVYTRSNEVLGFYMQKLGKMGSGNNFVQLNFEETSFPKKTIDAGALQGPTHQPNETPVLRTVVKNLSDANLTAVPRITVYKRALYFEAKPLFEQTLPDKLVLNPQEEKEFTLNLPSFASPESYLANIVFLTPSGQQISGILEARYVVAGASAKIVGASCSYEDGKLIVKQELVGPADSSTLTDVTQQIEVYDASGKILMSEKRVLTLGKEVQTVAFEKNMALESDKVRVVHTLIHNNKPLDTYELTYNSKDIAYSGKSTSERADADTVFKSPSDTPSSKVEGVEKDKPTLLANNGLTSDNINKQEAIERSESKESRNIWGTLAMVIMAIVLAIFAAAFVLHKKKNRNNFKRGSF